MFEFPGNIETVSRFATVSCSSILNARYMSKFTKPILKTPISYYGGQQNMLKEILPLIPPHHLYNEPFAGGAVLLFAKPPAEINVINDLNGEIVNFYRTAVADFEALSQEVGKTLHSREQMHVAKFIYNHPDYFSNVQRAWAVWAMSKLCFSSDFTGSFSLCRKGKSQTVQSIGRGKNNFTSALKSLLEQCTIEQDDALNIIRQYDSEGAFHYLAPPYVNCNMGHYENMFGEENLRQLLDTVSEIKGKFMLTMYPNDLIRQYAESQNWTIHRIDRTVTAANTKRRKQEEWMVVNYTLPESSN